MYDERTRAKAARSLVRGDNRALRPFRWWQLFTLRKLLAVRLTREDGRPVDYTVEVSSSGKHAGDWGMVHLFRDGRSSAASPWPAAFPVEGGTIEVDVGEHGLKRAHYVTTAGVEYQLIPHPRSAIGRRLRFDHEHPVVSSLIAGVSVLLLIIGIGLNALQFFEPVLAIPPIVETFGRFESPIDLPIWLNVALGVAAGLGGMERGLRLRYHWMLDGLGS